MRNAGRPVAVSPHSLCLLVKLCWHHVYLKISAALISDSVTIHPPVSRS